MTPVMYGVVDMFTEPDSSSKRDDAGICMNYNEAYQRLVSNILMSHVEKKKIMKRALNELPVRNSEMLSDWCILNYQEPRLLHIVLDFWIIQIQSTLMMRVRLTPG